MARQHSWVAKATLVEEQLVGVRGFITFSTPKVNALTWLEFELAYFNAVVQHFSYDTPGNSSTKEKGLYIFAKDRRTRNVVPNKALRNKAIFSKILKRFCGTFISCLYCCINRYNCPRCFLPTIAGYLY